MTERWYLVEGGENVFGDSVWIESTIFCGPPHRVREVYRWPDKICVRTVVEGTEWAIEKYKRQVGYRRTGEY